MTASTSPSASSVRCSPRSRSTWQKRSFVTRPGGRIVIGNWIPNDPTLVAQTLKISSSYSPPPPEGFVSPMTWGVEDNVIERFASAGVPKEKISFERDTYTFNFPGSPSEFLAAFQDVLRTDHERVRSCNRQRPRGRTAGRAGCPLQCPERKPERWHLDPCNVLARDGRGVRSRNGR